MNQEWYSISSRMAIQTRNHRNIFINGGTIQKVYLVRKKGKLEVLSDDEGQTGNYENKCK